MTRSFKILLALAATAALAGCQYDVLAPSGWVAAQQRDLLIISTLLMLIVIIPVIVMAVWFPLRYRADRTNQTDYAPDFAHSTRLEILVWGVPIAIVVVLGVLTWVYTHRLDPYRPLDNYASEPVEVQAVSLDWKWLFIYPDLGVASVNELAIPEGRPINLRLTSSTVMNTFSVPALAGMVYSMAGMETKLHLVADETGTFAGRSAHYSGPGFSDMTFDTLAMSEGDFENWVSNARTGGELSRASYLDLERPSMAEPVRYYGTVEEGLFDRAVGMCVEEGKVCMHTMMMQDEMGGGGLEGIPLEPLYEYDQQRAVDTHGNPLHAPAAGHDDMSSLEDHNHQAEDVHVN